VELGLKERLSTALMLEGWKTGRLSSPQPSTLPSFQPSLVALQRDDALAVARAIEPRRAFPLPWRRRPLLLAGLLVAATVVLALLPNRMDDLLAKRAQVARAAEEQARRIEQLADRVAEAQELSPEDRAELQRRLAELARRLRENQGDREQALADLSRLEEALQREIDPNAGARQAALEALAAQLQALAGEQSGMEADPADAEAGRQMDETLRSLAEQLAGANAEERQTLADRLGQMAARAAQSGDAELAQALADMARAAQAVDAEAASQAAQAAADAMRRAQGELAGDAARQRALAQLQQSRRSIAEAGQGRSSEGRAQGEDGAQAQPGEGMAGGQAQQPGQGQSGQGQSGQGQSGQGQGGQGTKADQLPPGTGQGQAGRPQGEGRSGEARELDQQIYVPFERRPGSGDELTIPGQDTGQGETEVRERTDPLPGSSSEALVPYYEVYYEYLDAANEAIERSYIPSGLKDVVREYFSRLEP
jgi:hypothetical protein